MILLKIKKKYNIKYKNEEEFDHLDHLCALNTIYEFTLKLFIAT